MFQVVGLITGCVTCTYCIHMCMHCSVLKHVYTLFLCICTPSAVVDSGEDKEYTPVKLSDLQRVETLGMGGFGRVELVSCCVDGACACTCTGDTCLILFSLIECSISSEYTCMCTVHVVGFNGTISFLHHTAGEVEVPFQQDICPEVLA